ncbi:MAG TPA: carboxypeptidase-like regulatory domain-containing protein, partial [Bryobacteraceae bacterium]|nr:carboxypeptidase-like regulatory domain-containing protein [Bryobacteraceae bacterium]
MNRAKCLLLSILVVLAVNGTVFSQTSSTSLQGTVTDPSGSVIAGATVVLSDSESKLERTVETGTQGEYRFIAVPPGTYTLTVTAKG